MLNLIRNTVSNFRLTKAKQDANNFLAAAGITGQVQSQAIYNLVNDLQASGLWSKMKAVYPMVTDNYNLLSYTEDFTNAYWAKTQLNATGNTTTAPNGTLTADTLTESSTNDYHVAQVQLGTLTANATFTASTSLKYIDRRYALIGFYLNQSPYPIIKVTVDLLNKSIVSSVGASASIILQDNNWFRVSVTGVVGNYSTNLWYQVALLDDSLNPSYLGSGKSMYIWGAQLEYGSLSTYQPIATTPTAFMASQMKYNLKDARDLDAAFRLTWSGGWTYSATGATPNGTNAYALTNLSQINAGMFNNYHMSYYSRTDYTSATGQVEMGVGSSPGNFSNVLLRLDTTTNYLGGSSGSRSVLATASNSLGHLTVNGLSTSAKAFKNGAIVATDATTQTGFPLTASIAIGAQYNGSVAGAYSSRQCAFASVGNGLSDNDAMLLNQIVEKYQVSLSRGVQAAQSFYYNSAYSNEANTYLYSTQITGTTQVSAINTLINGLKANNLWTKMKAVYPFVTDKTLQADMAAQMKFNLVNPQDSDAAFRLAFSGGWTYSTNGAQPNGTNGYADTKLNLASTLTQNDTHMSYYSRTNIIAANVEMGAIENTNIGTYLLYNFNGIAYKAFNSLESTRGSTYNPTTGILIGSRINSSTEKYYYRGALVDTLSVVSQPLVPRNVFIGAYSGNGSPYQYSSKQTAFATIGTGLSDAEVAILTQLVNDYQTTLSRQV